MTENRYLTSQEITDRYGIRRRYLKLLREKRRLKFIRLGHRTILYDANAVEDLLRRSTVDAIPDGRP